MSETPSLSFADGLRAAADLFDRLPDERYHTINVFVETAEDLTRLRRELGGRWTKEEAGEWFWLRRDLGGGVAVELNIQRSNVCERVQVGTETVQVPAPGQDIKYVDEDRPVFEWKCPDSLLAEVDHAV